MHVRLSLLAGVASLIFAANSFAQISGPPKETEQYKRDVGEWTCDISFWMAPDSEPQTTKGTESNRMLGDMWLISEFKADFGGTPFEGCGLFGFDPSTEKYVGSWVDSMSPYVTHMQGTWDAATKTMNQTGTGKDPTGNEMKMKSTISYKDDGTRVMTMYYQLPGADDWFKSMEIVYHKSKEKAAK